MRTLVTLACTDCKRRNYTTKKNKQNNPERIEAEEVLPLVRSSHAAPRDSLVVLAKCSGVVYNG